jgi:5'-3' exonuclease
MTAALIDADIVAYRCAATVENDGPHIGCLRADALMREILDANKADKYKAYMTGDSNFRYQLYPAYKANRAGKPRPQYLKDVQAFLIKEWHAEMVEGAEADDYLGVDQAEDTVICSIDKDLLQIPGKHYNFVKKEHVVISEIEGWRNFYKQLILGDVSDNIPGFDGKMRPKVPKFLLPELENIDACQSDKDMYESVLRLYQSHEWEHEVMKVDIHLNGQLLYIWKRLNDKWEVPSTVS